MKITVNTGDAPCAIGPYSQAVVSDGMVYLSGQIPLDPVSGKISGDDIAAQTERVLLNLKAVLTAAGSSLDNVLKTTVYMTDLKAFKEMNGVYETFFRDDPPARVTVQAASLPAGAMILIDAIAKVEEKERKKGFPRKGE